ncbi:hypothetical protein D9M70_482000 [compost metagenome]
MVIVTVGGLALKDGLAAAEILPGHNEQFGRMPASGRGGDNPFLGVLGGNVLANLAAVLVFHVQTHAQQHGQNGVGFAGQQLTGHGPGQPATVCITETQQASIVAVLSCIAGYGVYMQRPAQPFVERQMLASPAVYLEAVVPDARAQLDAVQSDAVVIDAIFRTLDFGRLWLRNQWVDAGGGHWAALQLARSLKSERVSGASIGQGGSTRPQPSVAAALVAEVLPGLPSVWRSSSPAMISTASGYRDCRCCPTARRLPQVIAQATVAPVLW